MNKLLIFTLFWICFLGSDLNAQTSGYCGKKQFAGVEIVGFPGSKNRNSLSDAKKFDLFKGIIIDYNRIIDLKRVWGINLHSYQLVNRNDYSSLEDYYSYPLYTPYDPIGSTHVYRNTFSYKIHLKGIGINFQKYFNGIAPIGNYLKAELFLYAYSVSYLDSTFSNIEWFEAYSEPINRKLYFNKGLSLEYGRSMIYYDRLMINAAVQIGFDGILHSISRGILGVDNGGDDYHSFGGITNENYFSKTGNKRVSGYRFVNFKFGIKYVF